MTDASKDPDVFLTQVNTAIEDVTEAIDDFIERMANILTDHLTEGGVIGGFLTGGILGGIVGGLAGHELEERFHAGEDRIWAAWRDAQEQIRQQIGSILGDPLKMSQISSNYRDAVRELGSVQGLVGEVNGLLGSSWSGRAYDAYVTASASQEQAIAGMSDLLLDAADLLDDNSLTLVQHWNDQLQNLADLVGGLISHSGGLGDAGNWATAGAGVAVELIGQLVSDVSSVVTAYLDYWATLNIGSAGDWDGLTASFGHHGLRDQRWPRPGDALTSAMNDPWEAA
ncbi:MAG: hypothetical protein HYU55_13650 [Nocardioides sp.]|nr:hypothetical protein [Nocardioides sp.]